MAKTRGLKDDIRLLLKEGYSYREITDILDCSRSTVHYHNPGKKARSDVDWVKVQSMADEGISVRKIADIIGVNYSTIYKNKSIKLRKRLSVEDFLDLWLCGKINGTIGKKVPAISRTVKRYLLEEADNKCSECGWGGINPISEKTVLEINHIDGDRRNSYRSNLEVLCPNCHSMTSTHRGLNVSSRVA